LVTPKFELLDALIGNISQVYLMDSILAVILSILVFYIIKRNYSKIMLASISEDLAIANKINVKKQNLIYLLTIGLIVALGVKVVGTLLIGALVIVPAAASRNMSRNMRQYIFISILIGSLSGALGILAFKITGFQVGPLIILISIFFFVISLLFGKTKNFIKT